MDLKQKQDAIVAGPGSIDLGGQTLLVRRHTRADLLAVRGRIMGSLPKPTEAFGQIARSPAWEFLDEDERKRMAKDAAGKQLAGEQVISEDRAWELIGQPDHCRFLARLLLVGPHNPGLTKDEVNAAIDDDNASSVAWTLLEQCGGVVLGNDSSSPSS